MNKETRWYGAMLAKYGSDEAISKIMRTNSNQSSRNKGGKFNAVSEEHAMEVRRRGGYAKAEKVRAEKQEAISSEDGAQGQETDSDQT